MGLGPCGQSLEGVYGVLSCLMSFCCMLSTVWYFDHIAGEEGLVPLLVVGL